jgi:hypothetical protein
MSNAQLLTQERLRELVSYDPETGMFTRLRNGKQASRVGNGEGYLTLMLDGARHKQHRLAVLYMSGAWPEEEVDHINGVRDDNRWSNLRCVSKSLNMHNRRLHKNSTTGFAGVAFEKDRGLWKAHIHANGRKMNLGRFKSPEMAHQAYQLAKRALHAGSTL